MAVADSGPTIMATHRNSNNNNSLFYSLARSWVLRNMKLHFDKETDYLGNGREVPDSWLIQLGIGVVLIWYGII